MYKGIGAHGTLDLMKSEGRNERLCSVPDRLGRGEQGAMPPSDPVKDYLLIDLHKVAQAASAFYSENNSCPITSRVGFTTDVW